MTFLVERQRTITCVRSRSISRTLALPYPKPIQTQASESATTGARPRAQRRSEAFDSVGARLVMVNS